MKAEETVSTDLYKNSTFFIKLRERAEKLIKGHSAPGGETSDVDLLHLIHELEVQHVELELQNEELRQAQKDLEDSRNQYHSLYHLAPIGFVSLSLQGIITLTNQVAEEMLAGPNDSLRGSPFSRRILSEDYQLYFSCLKKVGQNGGRQTCEVRLTGNGKRVLFVRIEAGAGKDGAGHLTEWRLVLSDISKQKEAEEALCKSESLRIANEGTRMILESITDGFMALDLNWHIIYFNKTGARMLGLDRKNLIGGLLWELFPHATSSKFYSEYHRALETHMPVHFEEFYPEPLNLWVECHCYPSVEGLSVYFRDITDRKHEEVYQALLTDILHVLNSGGEINSIIADILRLIRERIGFDAVGLRLRQGDDFPYYEHKGFSRDFLHEENFLVAKGCNGAMIRNAEGVPVLECMCGLVLSGSIDTSMPYFTESGSFWSNDTSEFLTLPEDADPRTNPRNTCIDKGYRSVGLFPVRAGKQIIGLLQANDICKGVFSPNLIAFFENLARNIGLALQRTAAEEARRESADRLARAQQIAHLGSWELDLIKNELNWSDEVYRIFGFQPKQFGVTYDIFLECIHPDDRAAVDTAYQDSLRENLDAYEIEHRVIRKSTGEIRFVHEKCEHFRDASDRFIRSVGMILDITERKQAEQALQQLNETLEQKVTERTQVAESRAKQLQSLAVELTEAEERERQRIAQLLHDDLQQMLAAAKMQLQMVSNNMPNEPMLKNVESILKESITKSRQLAHELSPAVLHHSGLIAGLQWLSSQMHDRFGLHVELEAVAEFENTPLMVFMFRAAQELLFNIVKHSGVKSARVGLSNSNGGCLLTVIDQGKGFDPELLNSFQVKGMGLLSLRERTNAIGGSLTIKSSPGQGTRFSLWLPACPE